MEDDLSPGSINQTLGNASKVRPYFSLQHIAAVQMFADMSAQIEDKYTAEKSFTNTESRLQYSFVINAIISSVAFLEARINELFADAADTEAWTLPGETKKQATNQPRQNPMVSDLPDETVSQLARSWKSGIPKTAKYSVQEKYQTALMLARKELFDPGSSTLFQWIGLLVNLRNYLIHAEPEWIVTASPNEKDLNAHKFEGKFKGLFPDNPTVRAERKYFPDRCLGSGCAKWAVTSSTKFVDEFLTRIGSSAATHEEFRCFPCGFSFQVTHPDEIQRLIWSALGEASA